ncbi:MAG: 2-amino-4-hydroxy-6-hydroxymethyldihydropteridine diphosphokinase [Cyanobacteria bacterium P01_C01_bin.89]
MTQAILSVGSNINPQKNCQKAEEILAEEHQFLGKSDYIVTAPVGYQDQDDFLNGAYWIETNLNHDDFNAYLKDLERRLKRVKTAIKSGPRTIDLDIIVWDGKVVHDDFHTKDYTKIPIKNLFDRYGLSLERLNSAHPVA